MAFQREDTIITVALLLVALMLVLAVALVLASLRLRGWRTEADRERLRQWNRRLLDASFDGMVIHRGGMVLQMNSALQRMLGTRERDWLGQDFSKLARPDQTRALHAALEAPPPHVAAFDLLRPDKAEIAVELFSQTIAFDDVPATVTAIKDISQRLADAARITRLLDYDALTGLANRKLFLEKLASRLGALDGAPDRAHDHALGCAALFSIDLYQFKTVNQQIGRTAGDQLLKQVAARIAGLTCEDDVLGRVGGGKFGLLLCVPSGSVAGTAIAGTAIAGTAIAGASVAGVSMVGVSVLDRASLLATQLEAAFNKPFITNGQLVKASLSIGMALYPDHADDAESLLRASDFALTQVGAGGGGFSLMFSPEDAKTQNMNGRDGFRIGLTESQRLSQDLRGALAGNDIGLVYQPIFRADDLALVGYEALARWTHKRDGQIAPSIFIPLAEQAGLIHEIGSFVLETACAEAATRPAHLKMAVNLSPLQFRDLNLPARISAILRKTGLAPSQLELEVTESVLIENSAAATRALAALRAIGVNVALDDFGTGYSSLSYLCDYPFARLKIDKRFVQALGKDDNADAIVVAILSLARDLRLDVTAEGVETDAQLNFLQKQNCPQVQGFLLGRPVTRALLPQAAAVPPPRDRAMALPTTLIPTRAI